MKKLKIIEHISLDGVIQNSADGGDFLYSDGPRPIAPAGRDEVLAAYGERFDLLLGRRTYDIWSGFWPKAPSSPSTPRRFLLPALARITPGALSISQSLGRLFAIE